MIELNNLNNQTLKEIIETAKNQVSILSDDWTNIQEYDPGVTLIELFSWIKFSQNSHINEVSRLSYFSFLDLIGIKRKSNVGAKTFLSLSNIKSSLCIPGCTKWKSENFVFENENEVEITNAKIKKIEFNNDDKSSVVDYSLIDGQKSYYLFGDLNRIQYNPSFTICFDDGLLSGKKYSLHFEMTNQMKEKRNPVLDAKEFIPMSKVLWEYYGEKDGVVGWHEIKIVQDNTYGFLFSGIVNFVVTGKMNVVDDLYKIRVTLLYEDYDFPPRINDLRVNVIEVEQKNTLCKTFNVYKKDIDSKNEFKIKSGLSIYGDNECYIRKNESWILTEKIKFQRMCEEGYTSFYASELADYFDRFREDEIVLRVACYSKELKNGTSIGDGKGVSSQIVDVRYPDIKYDDFNIVVGRKVGDEYCYDDWEKVESFVSSDKYDKHYILNTDKKLIGFGNHERGMVPYKGLGNIRFKSLSCTSGINSNIRSHMINSVLSENKNILNLQIEQFLPATGGFYYESLNDMKRKALELFEQGEKAVTISDYENIVKSTPGLIIDNVRVLPSYSPVKTDDVDRCVTIVVREGRKNKEQPLNSYRDNIIKHINKHRLISTKIYVIAPTYVGITVTGEIVLNSHSNEDKIVVYDTIKKFVDKLNQTWGSDFCRGDLFGLISKLDVVNEIKSLHVIPNGDYLERKSSEDIIAKPNGSYYIEEIDVFLRN